VWAQEAALDPAVADPVALFGCAVAISGDTIAVGAKRSLDGKPGAVHVFVRTAGAWTEQATLVASDGGADDQFGSDVSLSGDTLAASAPHFSDPPHDGRHPTVFRRSGTAWTQDSPLALVGPTEQIISVSVSGTTLLAGDNGTDTVHVLASNAGGWTDEAFLQPSPGFNLGYSVAVAGDLVVVGGIGIDDAQGGTKPGNAYAYGHRTGGFSLPLALPYPESLSSTEFGHPVAVSGTTVVVGAAGLGTYPGAVFVFDLAVSGE
jgi:hypothetical protein